MEVDAYCFSTIASYCNTTLGNLATTAITTGANGNAVDELNKGLLYFDEHEIPAEKQVILASPSFMNALRGDTKELSRFLMQADYNKDVKFTLTSYEGRKFAMVPPQRFRTNIVLGSNGYTWGTGNQAIDFMIVSTDAVLHVVKYNKVKILSGDVVLAGRNYDGYAIYARVYHDVFVPDNKRFALYCHTSNTANVANKLDVNVVSGKIAGITFFPGDKLVKYATSSATETVGSAVATTSTLTKVGIGTSVSTGDVIYAIDPVDNTVLASYTVA